ncbi:NADP-dependent 3-hydroxy acid dehydrogenase YdfG [Kitasatospora sp. GAS1066B]
MECTSSGGLELLTGFHKHTHTYTHTQELMKMTDSPVTLITGGSSGIGAAAARQLLKLGHRVAVTARGEERLRRFAEEVGQPAALLTITGDAADPAAVRAAVAATVERFGRLDHAVANAGFSTHDTLADGDPAGWREMVLTNVLGPALLVQAALPELTRSRGRIVLVGSVAGFINSPGNLYGVTKWAVRGLAENTRLMVTDSGVGVTLIAPGRVETAFWDQREGGTPATSLLTEDQVASSIVWALGQPQGVDVNTVIVRPIGQER